MTDTPAPISNDQLSGDYTVDPAHSRIGFVARHAMITKIRGAFNDFQAKLHIDATDPAKSSANVVIQATSIDTRNADRDAHLQSNDFFAMDKHPTITFRSTAADKLDDETYRVAGDLTIRGETRPVSIDFEFLGAVNDPMGNLRLGFEGSLVVNRKDWGINWNAALDAGGVLIGEKVTLEFELSATKDA